MTDGVCINVILLTIIICLPWDELSGVHYMCMLAIWLANDVSSSFCSIVERRKIFVCARCTLRSKPRISCVGFFFFHFAFHSTVRSFLFLLLFGRFIIIGVSAFCRCWSWQRNFEHIHHPICDMRVRALPPLRFSTVQNPPY